MAIYDKGPGTPGKRMATPRTGVGPGQGRANGKVEHARSGRPQKTTVL